VHWFWSWNFRKCIALGKLYQLFLILTFIPCIFSSIYIISHSAVTIVAPHHRCTYCHPD
jgi:hypothetical protein